MSNLVLIEACLLGVLERKGKDVKTQINLNENIEKVIEDKREWMEFLFSRNLYHSIFSILHLGITFLEMVGKY